MLRRIGLPLICGCVLVLVAGCSKPKPKPRTVSKLVYKLDWKASPSQRSSASRADALKTNREVIMKRLKAFEVQGEVQPRDESTLEVRVFDTSAKTLEELKTVLALNGELALRYVDHESDWLSTQKKAFEKFRETRPKEAAGIVWVDTRQAETERVRERTNWFGSYVRSKSKGEIQAFLNTLIVMPYRILGYEKVTNLGGKEVFWRSVLLESKVIVTARDIKRASVQYDDNGPYVSLDLKPDAARRFGDETEANVERFLAVMVDDEVLTAPKIMERIGGGRVRISMGAAAPSTRVLESKSLVIAIASGAYAAPMTLVADR